MAGIPFSNLFGQSPIRPIQEHIQLAHQCAEQLLPFIEATLADDWPAATAIHKSISDLEIGFLIIIGIILQFTIFYRVKKSDKN